MKKFTAILLAIIVVLSTSVVAFAADVYTCPTCNKKYESLTEYNACIGAHSAPEEEEGDIYECATCHKKYEDINEYNACVDTHFNNVNYHYDKYVNLTIVELINSIIDMFNNAGIKEIISSLAEKASSLLSMFLDTVPEVEA